MLNLDTHILIYALAGKLRGKERALLESDGWGISAIVLWELAKLAQLGRIDLDLDDREVVRQLRQVHVWPIDLEIARISTRLDFRGDPADELIAATSIVHQVPLVTRDKVIRRSKLVPFGQDGPMRTIVGGRPQKGGGSGGGAARGIDVLLLKACVDAEFRAELSRDFSAAAESIDLALTESERAILASLPGETLAAMAARMRVPKAHRPAFLGRTAAAMLTIAAGLAAASCGPPPPKLKKPVTLPFTNPAENEPPSWIPQAVFIAGASFGPVPRTQDYDSRDEAPQPGDQDPAEVNEPPVWNPPVPIFGLAPEWNERTHDYESEDEAG